MGGKAASRAKKAVGSDSGAPDTGAAVVAEDLDAEPAEDLDVDVDVADLEDVVVDDDTVVAEPYEETAANDLSLVPLACALIVYQLRRFLG